MRIGDKRLLWQFVPIIAFMLFFFAFFRIACCIAESKVYEREGIHATAFNLFMGRTP